MTATIAEHLGADGKIRLAVEGIRQNAHAKVLVVGCRGNNFPEPWRSHPQLLFRDDDDAGDEIPAAVRLVLVTRFLAHHDYGLLSRACATRGITFSTKLMGTGEIKALLTPLMNGRRPEPEPETGGATDVKTDDNGQRRFIKGELRAFIAEHGDIDKEPFKDEAERLYKLAAARGYATTVESVKQALYMLRQDRAERERTRQALARSIATGAAAGPAVTQQPVVAAAPALTLAEDDTELVRMLDEMTAKLNDFAAAVGLIRETVLRRGEKRRQLKELLQGL